MLPPKSPKKHHTAPTYNQMHAGPPLPPNKPKVFVGQFETQKQEKSMPGTNLEFCLIVSWPPGVGSGRAGEVMDMLLSR